MPKNTYQVLIYRYRLVRIGSRPSCRGRFQSFSDHFYQQPLKGD